MKDFRRLRERGLTRAENFAELFGNALFLRSRRCAEPCRGKNLSECGSVGIMKTGNRRGAEICGIAEKSSYRIQCPAAGKKSVAAGCKGNDDFLTGTDENELTKHAAENDAQIVPCKPYLISVAVTAEAVVGNVPA